jgi:hypothetical protein
MESINKLNIKIEDQDIENNIQFLTNMVKSIISIFKNN